MIFIGEGRGEFSQRIFTFFHFLLIFHVSLAEAVTTYDYILFMLCTQTWFSIKPLKAEYIFILLFIRYFCI